MPTTASPKSNFQQQTPISNRKKKSALVFRDGHQAPNAGGGAIKTDRIHVTRLDETASEVEKLQQRGNLNKDPSKKPSRKLENMIRQAKKINKMDMEISSLTNQEKHLDSQSIDSAHGIGEGIQLSGSMGMHTNAHKLQ